MYIHSTKGSHTTRRRELAGQLFSLVCELVHSRASRASGEKRKKRTPGRSRESQKLPKNSGRPLSILVKKYKNFFLFFYSLILFQVDLSDCVVFVCVLSISCFLTRVCLCTISPPTLYVCSRSSVLGLYYQVDQIFV